LRSWRVPSHSRPGVEYTVSVDDGGVWSCTCPHYTYRHTICKHIVMVQTELSAYNGPRDLIKKGRRFKAGATITKIEVVTTTLIHDVVEA
jgi:uncharacterized Zn finger protein